MLDVRPKKLCASNCSRFPNKEQYKAALHANNSFSWPSSSRVLFQYCKCDSKNIACKVNSITEAETNVGLEIKFKHLTFFKHFFRLEMFK